MKMLLTPAPLVGVHKSWTRWARGVALAGLVAVGLLGSVRAQSFAISTYGGAALSPNSTNTGTGPATLARFNNPAGIAIDSTGTNLYVADAANHLIRKVVIATGVTTTLAGTGSAGSADNAMGTSASFNAPQGIAIDSTNTNLYVADTGNHKIRKIVISSTAVTTIAGSGVFNPYVDSGATGTAVTFNSPLALAVDSTSTNLYVADTGNSNIRQIVLSGTFAVSTFAGSTAGATSGTTDNVVGTAARFNHPSAIAADATNLYVADTNNHAIRKIVIGSQSVSTLAGLIGTSGSTDASGASARFNGPAGIVAKALNLYIADTLNNTIRQVVISSGATTTLAGTAGAAGTGDGVGTAARFQGPTGIAADTSANLYIADTNNQTIRFGGPASAPSIGGSGTNASTAVGGSATFTVTGVTGNPTPTYQWQRQPAAGGGFTSLSNVSPYSGVTTATLSINPATLAMNGDQFQCVVTNGVSSVTSTAKTLTVQQAPTITSANSTTFNLTQAGTFTVTATGSGTMTYSVISGSFPSWASIGSSSGVISGTPPNTTGSPFTFTIQASNSVGSPATQSFTLTVAAGPSITSQPSNQTVGAGASAQFSVTATAATSYQWLRQPAGGSGFTVLSDNGIYSGSGTATLTVSNSTLAMSGDQFQVNVTNNVGTTPSSVATLSITQSPNITSLNSTTFVENTSSSFTILATGSPAPTFTLTGGSLPSGITLDSSSGILSGTPAVGASTSSPYNLQFTASNGVGSAAVQNFTLTVTPTALVPAFTTQPSNLTVALGQTATFTVVATGTPTPTYQWQRQLSGSSGFNNFGDDSTFSGTATATLTITNPSSGMSGDQYRCVATNTSGSTASNAATLTVVVGTTITTFAGQAGSVGSLDGTGTAARFSGPAAITIDSSGNFYVADSANNVIRKITSGGVVTTLAGQAGSSGNVDGTGSAARFNAPSGIAVDPAGNIYVADTYNHTIRVVTSSGVVTTLAGLAGNPGAVDGAGNTARFNYPTGVAVDSSSTIYVADSFNHAIRRIISGTVSTYAGSLGVRGNTDSPARFAYPNSLAVDSSGNVYVADSFNQTIRKITGGSVSTIAGVAGTIGSSDGTGSGALFNQPSGVVVDSSGNIYVADTGANTIRKITSGGAVTTIAGSAGNTGSADGSGSTARFNAPFGLTVDGSGNLFIVDTRNQTIRRSGSVSAPSIQTQPQNQTAGVGQNATFTVAATGSPAPSIFQWQRQPAGTTGFLNLSNDGTYSGTTSSTLTITGVTSGMSGDQFVVVVSNLISPSATSNTASLTTLPPAVFTSASSATFNVGQSNSFSVTTTSATTVTYSAAGLPSWLSLDPLSGILSGTPPGTAGSPLSLTLTANNGAPATQNFTLNLVVPVLPPSISTSPASITVNTGDTATFTVVATGTVPFSYQWNKGGIPITGATGSTLTLSNVTAGMAGSYSVTINNSVGTTTSATAALVVNATPIVSAPPRPQTIIAGNPVTFTVSATGSPSPTYQWRFNGVAIAGANGSSYTIASAQTANAGNYDVIVGNLLGQIVSSEAQLSVVTTLSAPVITSQPSSRTILVGGATTFTVSAAGAPAPSYQWRKNGAPINGATTSTLLINNAQTSDAGSYSVVVSNATGSVTSAVGNLGVIRRSYAGTYFGSFGAGVGSFAIYIRADNTGVFLGYLPGAGFTVKNVGLTVSDSGQFSFTQAASSAVGAQPADAGTRAAAAGDATLVGSIANDGTLSGSVTGVSGASLSGTKSADIGTTQAVAGYYQAAAANSSSSLFSIAGAAGQAFVLVQTSTTSDGGAGTVDGTGRIAVTTAREVIALNVNAATSTLGGTTITGSTVTTYSGAAEAVIANQRLGNISTRANVGTGNNVAIAGFVISGTDSKPVLIRAIGPTLSLFGIGSPLSNPKLELFNGANVSIANNTAWSTAPNTAAIVAASSQAGAFALGATTADSVIFTTLAPGNYTAVVSSANGGTGVALIEVYDLSAPAAGQKLFNISTRANAGTGANTLAAGFVVNGAAPKRVLIRGVGPGLVQFGFTNALGATQLQLFNSSNQVIVQNTGWSTSADASAIATASSQVGAFPIVAGSLDSAMIVSLAPGSYTAQINPVNGTTGGVAIIEVYELP